MEEPNRELLAEIFTEMQFTSLIKEMELTPTIAVPSAAPEKAAPQSAQMSLFGDTPMAAAGAVKAYKTIEDVPHTYHIAETNEQLEELVATLRGNGEFTFDTETVGLNPFEDRVVGMSFAIREHEAWYVPVTPGRQAEIMAIFRPLFEDEAIGKTGQNIKFDILHIISKDERALKAWMKYVADGGLVWDLQLAEYVMEGQDQASHMLSMDELALRYGEDLKVDEVKKLWEAGIDTPDIDPDLLSRYLLGEDLPNGGRREGDIGVTRNVFLKQLARAQKEGMSRLLMLEFGALIASIEMERNGMYVDKALGYKLADELRVELAAAKDELHAYLPVDLPFEFNWGNRYHLSPVIFGGKVKYQRRQYDMKDGKTTFIPPSPTDMHLYAYEQKDTTHYVLEDGTTMECLWWEHCFHTEWQGESPRGKDRVQYKAGKNAGEYKTKKVKVDDYDKPKSRMVDDYWEFPGFTKPLAEWASSTDGLYSVGSDVIKTLTENTTIPFLKTLGRVTAISKDLGTYFISDDGEKGMLTLVGDDGLVHHSINHTSTVTGRLSGNSPNLQNIPKGNKSKAKQMFVSRFPDGDIGQSDFSSLEVYCQAWLTKPKLLIKDLLEGLDLHCVRLAAKEAKPYEEVLKLCKGYFQDDGTFIDAIEEWDYKRTGAKVFSFQRAYGAGVATIAKATGMSIEDVQALIDAENARYPEIESYFSNLEQEIEQNAVPTTNFSAHPMNPAVRVQMRISRIRTPDGKRYTFRSHPSQGWQLKRGITSSFSPTERMNYPVQGLGGQVMKAAMWLNVREFYRHENFNGLALLVNTVHDAAYRDAHPSVSLASSELMHACMEAASDFIAYWFKWDIPLPVPTDSVRGANMGEEVKLNSQEFKANVAAIRADLRARYMDGFVPNYLTLKDYQ